MRIGLITGEYPPMEGGVGAYARELAKELLALNHDVYILTRQEAVTAEQNDIPVAARIGATWNPAANRIAMEWAEEANLDVVNVQFQTAAYNMHAAIHFIKTWINRPLVVTFHDLRVPYLFPKAGPLRTWIMKRLAHSAEDVISTDRDDQHKLNDWGIDATWIPIGSNIAAPLRTPEVVSRARQSMGLRDDELCLAYFGFLNESKGALTLVQAAEQIKTAGIPIRLLMIGGRAGASDPTNYAYGERIDHAIEVAELTDQTIWTGFVSDDEVSAYFFASNIVALPYRDGVSLRRGTLMAALAHGCTIVTTTPSTPLPELDGAMAIVPIDDPAALANEVQDLWADPDRRIALGRRASEAASQFTWDKIAEQTQAVYRKLIGRLNHD